MREEHCGGREGRPPKEGLRTYNSICVLCSDREARTFVLKYHASFSKSEKKRRAKEHNEMKKRRLMLTIRFTSLPKKRGGSRNNKQRETTPPPKRKWEEIMGRPQSKGEPHARMFCFCFTNDKALPSKEETPPP